MDQDLIDARIDCLYQILDRVMHDFVDFEKIKGLQNYQDLFGTADNAIDEKWAMFRGAMTQMTKEKSELIKNCEAKMRQAEIQAEADSIAAIASYKKVEKHRSRAIEKMRDENQEIDWDKDEEELEDKVEELRCSLLDIEIKLGDALRTAFS